MKHDAPNGNTVRFWRGLLNSIDKGAGAERRARNLKRAQHVFEAFLMSGGNLIEGQIAVGERSITFAPVAGDRPTSILVDRMTTSNRRRTLLHRDGGFRPARVIELDLGGNDGLTYVIGVSRRDIAAITALCMPDS